MARSLNKQEYLFPGHYEGLWSGSFVEIIFQNGMRTCKIEVDEQVRGMKCKCDILVDEQGYLNIK